MSGSMIDTTTDYQIEHATEILKAMANRRRLEILTLLADGEKCVGGLVTALGMAQSAVSQHLAKLRSAQLVETRRESRTIYYSIKGGTPAAVMAAIRGEATA